MVIDRHGPEADEAARLAALRRYDVMDTAPEAPFDRLAALAAQTLGTPIALISLVERHRVWFKARHGLAVCELPRTAGLCAAAVLDDGVHVVADAATDPRAKHHPLVVGAPGLAFYAGVPLRTEDGHRIGVLSVADVVPRSVSDGQLCVLGGLAATVMDQLAWRVAARRADRLDEALAQARAELDHHASRDALTGVWNRRAILALLEQSHARAARHGRPLALLLLDVDFFKRVNDTHGHGAGDQVLQVVTDRLHAVLRAGDTIGRTGGEEFLALLDGCDAEQAVEVAERCRAAICDKPIKLPDRGRTALRVSVSVGLAVVSAHGGAPVGDAMALADAALHRAKHAGRNRVVSFAA